MWCTVAASRFNQTKERALFSVHCGEEGADKRRVPFVVALVGSTFATTTLPAVSNWRSSGPISLVCTHPEWQFFTWALILQLNSTSVFGGNTSNRVLDVGFLSVTSGRYTFEVQGRNSIGGVLTPPWTSSVFELDYSMPEAKFSRVPDPISMLVSPSFTATAVDSVGVAELRYSVCNSSSCLPVAGVSWLSLCQVNSGGLLLHHISPCNCTAELSGPSGEPRFSNCSAEFRLPFSLQHGVYSVFVLAIDTAGNNATAEYTWQVDVEKPLPSLSADTLSMFSNFSSLNSTTVTLMGYDAFGLNSLFYSFCFGNCPAETSINWVPGCALDGVTAVKRCNCSSMPLKSCGATAPPQWCFRHCQMEFTRSQLEPLILPAIQERRFTPGESLQSRLFPLSCHSRQC